MIVKRVLHSGFWPTLLFCALMLVMLLCHALPHHVRVVADNLAQCLGPLVAALWALRGPRTDTSHGSAHRVPTFLCLGVLGYAAGQIIWTFYELVLHRVTPFPSWADAGYLSAYPFLFMGVLGLPTRSLPLTARLRAFFDGLMIIVALVTFSWYFVLGPTLLQSGETMLARVIGTAYPLADLVLLCSGLILAYRAGDAALRPVVLPLCAGFIMIISVDSVFDYQTLHNTYATGSPIDVCWPLGYMLVAVAARAARRVFVSQSAPGSTNAHTTHRLAGAEGTKLPSSIKRMAAVGPSLFSYIVIPFVAGLVWHAIHTRGDEKFENGVYIGACLLGALLLVRQFLTLLENQHLAQQTIAFNTTLEKTVAERTEQVAALQRLTAAVSGTLEAEHVLAAALWHTQQVVSADGVVVWLRTDTGFELGPSIVHQCGLDGRPEALAIFRQEPNILDDVTSRRDGSANHYLLAPLRWREQTLGWVGAARWSRDFGAGETRMLLSIGLQVGAALENARQFHAARQAADHDPVTGLLNHRAIHQYLDEALEEAGRSTLPAAVIMADLDNFKLFNDTFGHPAGDQVLRRVAQLLSEECGPDVRVARYGGDEFLLALPPGCDLQRAHVLAQRLRSRLAGEVLQNCQDERTIPLSMSFGVAAFPCDSTNRHDLLDTADTNLYAAKESDERIVGLSEMQRGNRALRAQGAYRTLDGMVTAVDNKDRYTRRHSEDVTVYAQWIAEEVGLDENVRRILRTGGLLHDVGKIGVPDNILRKPSRLLDEEYEVLKQHPSLGALIVAGVPGMQDLLGVVRHHHERWDGHGYPDGLAGADIPLEARVLAVADAVSAMTTDRPYRKGLDWQTVLKEVRHGSGTQFDPDLAAAFIRAAQTHGLIKANVGLEIQVHSLELAA